MPSSSTTAPYPPPLSAPPTVGTLRDLLDALQAGTYEVPPVPPLPGATAARETTATRPTIRWRVEHATSGVPVQLSVGDRLDIAELRHLRDQLGARWWSDEHPTTAEDEPVAAPAPTVPTVPTVPTASATPAAPAPSAAPPLSWSADAAEPTASTGGVALAGALGAGIAAAAAAAARFLDAVGLP